jgi:hypothetical protein
MVDSLTEYDRSELFSSLMVTNLIGGFLVTEIHHVGLVSVSNSETLTHLRTRFVGLALYFMF